ncbi:glycosyltransferase [Gordonia sp. CPCC 205515]|uniref:glycosyltransferase n=1 Tax=Gordonia sp. CPCC 205515 TaxID=3140791 RepID=UPI003AF34F71
MARILFVTWDGGGNVTPAVTLAGELVKRGHGVRFIGHPSQREALSGRGFCVQSYRTARAFSASVGSKPLTMVKLFSDRGMGADVLEELAARPADLVVVDCLLFGVMDALRARGIGYVVLEHLYDGYLRKDGLKGPVGLGLRIRGYSPIELLGSAATVLVATAPELDPLSVARGNREQIGPLVAGRAAMPTEPVVLVSLSTFGYPKMRETLQRIVDAIGELGVRGIVTTGPLVDPSSLRVGPGIEVHSFVPHAELMPHVSAVVGHGGHSTTMLALAHDLPVLALTLFGLGDQPRVGRSLQDAGAGRMMSRRSRSSALRPAIEELLSNIEIRTAAARLGGDIRALDGIATGADRIEALIGDMTPRARF